MKKLPPEMRDWYFPFNWDVRRLWALDLPVESRPLSGLRWHLDIPIWSSRKGMHFDLRPVEVIENPGRYPRHDRRIERADVSFPIHMMYTVSRLAILDGVHRLAKQELEGSRQVAVRIVPREMIPLFAEP